MTREQAIELDSKLKEQLQNYAKSQNIDESISTYLVDNFVEFIPQETIMGMIFLGDRAVSYKPANIRVDLRKALTGVLEYAVSVNRPESVFGAIQLVILSVLFIYKSVRQELDQLEAYAVYFLHTKGAYGYGVEEEQFILEFMKWYQHKVGSSVKREEIVEAINHLYSIEVADFENGNIIMKEKVWGEM